MRYHYYKAVFGDLLYKLHYLHGCLAVKGARRLVGEKYLRIVHECASYCYTLHLTARHLIRALVELISQAYLLKRLLCALTAFRFGHSR